MALNWPGERYAGAKTGLALDERLRCHLHRCIGYWNDGLGTDYWYSLLINLSFSLSTSNYAVLTSAQNQAESGEPPVLS